MNKKQNFKLQYLKFLYSEKILKKCLKYGYSPNEKELSYFKLTIEDHNKFLKEAKKFNTWYLFSEPKPELE